MEAFDPYYQWLGIPSKDQPPTAYRLLGVEPFESNPSVIDAAAEQRMLLLRARQVGARADESQRLLNEISQARRLLLDPDRKAEYDLRLQSLSSEPDVDSIELKLIDAASPNRPRRRSRFPTPVVASLSVAGCLLLFALMWLGASAWSAGKQKADATHDSRPPQKVFRPVVPEPRLPSSWDDGVNRPDVQRPVVESRLSIPNTSSVSAQQADGTNTPGQTTEPAQVPRDLSSPPSTTDASGSTDVHPSRRQLLQLSDLRFVGAFKLPQEACGASTGYAPGCLALRKVNGKARLFADAHIYSGGKIYEVDVPALARDEPYPTASIVHEWGDIYHGRKRNQAGQFYELNERIPTNGLRWDEARQQLWWVYGEKYNTENQEAPTFGFTHIEGETTTAHGPWKLAAAQSWQRGGTLEIPQWFADKHTGGRRLGIGFGGYYSIFKGGSYGPALLAAAEPQEGKQPSHVMLLGYPDPHFCIRDANYHHVVAGWMGRDPVDDVGTWNATDEIGGETYAGGAVWIDAADKHGVLFFVSLGTGRIAYEDGAVTSEDRTNALYIYDPDELAEVASGTKQSWEPTPRRYPLKNPSPGLVGRPAGVAYDAESRRLYVVFVHAYVQGEEAYPAVVVYQI